SSLRFRVEPVADAVAQEVEAHHHTKDCETRKCRNPPLLDKVPSLGDHSPPFRGRRYYAEPKKAKPCKCDNCVADVERKQRDNWAEYVRQYMPPQDTLRPISQRAGRLDILM